MTINFQAQGKGKHVAIKDGKQVALIEGYDTRSRFGGSMRAGYHVQLLDPDTGKPAMGLDGINARPKYSATKETLREAKEWVVCMLSREDLDVRDTRNYKALYGNRA